jgi:UDP-glucose 4-epimerase
MKVLITGVAGLMGSKLADYLLEKGGISVSGIDDLSGGYSDNVDDRVDFHLGDLVDGVFVKTVISKVKPDIVYHMAAYAAEGLSPFVRKFNYENNLIATTNIISQCIENEVDRIVYTSSMSVYGDIHKPPFNEKMLPQPIDPYAIAKYASEMDLRVAYEQHGLKYTIIRPHNFYGDKQNIWDKYRNVLGIWMYQILNDLPPTIYGDGMQKRAFSYISDSLEPMWQASQSDACIGETINLGGIQEYTINEACSTLIEVTGLPISPVYHEERHEAKNAWSTWEKSVDYLGFEHKVDLGEGLEKMWNWAQKKPMRKRFEWEVFEIEKGLYSYWRENDK